MRGAGCRVDTDPWGGYYGADRRRGLHGHDTGSDAGERHMPVTVIVGGQFGSEGKGKVAHHFARELRASIAVRVGGSNSGHTVIDDHGVARIFRMLPTAAILPDTICVLGAGSYVDVDVLKSEIESVGLAPDRLIIDPNAYIVSNNHKRAERDWGLGKRIGSTLSGTGAAVVDRILRSSTHHLARNDERLAPYVAKGSVRAFLRTHLRRGDHIVLEGTQGFGLSLLHSPYYPKTTSRDTTAAAFVAEAGLSPFDVEDIVLVIRAFPIRVPGDSGPLPDEIDWPTVAKEAGSLTSIEEQTSVTKRPRRVARFHNHIVRLAIETNLPTQIALNHVDYFDVQCTKVGALTTRAKTGLSQIERSIGQRVDLIGIGASKLIVNDYSAGIQLLSA